MPEPFDRDATKEAIGAWVDWWINGKIADVRGFDGEAQERVLAAARWAVEVTEGDGIWWCERHQCRWGYTPDCGWSPRGEACPKSRRLLIEWEADGNRHDA